MTTDSFSEESVGDSKPEDSDPESEIQEEKESVRRNSGKTLRVPLVQGGVCVQKKAHWPARYRSITMERR